MFGVGKVALGFTKYLLQPSQSAVKHLQYCSCIPPSRQVNYNHTENGSRRTALPKFQQSLRYSSTDVEDLNEYKSKHEIFQMFDICKVTVEKPGKEDEHKVVQFIYDNHFMREPSIINLNIPLTNPYLSYLANRYAGASDRWCAFMVDPRTKKRRLVGIMAAFIKYPADIERLYALAANSCAPHCYLINFQAQCLSTVDFCAKYNVPYVYDIELLAASYDAPTTQIKDLLLWHVMSYAKGERYPLVTLVATTYLQSLVGARGNMVHEWRKDYVKFFDNAGRQMFCQCTPDMAVDVFTLLRKPCDLGFPKNFQCKPKNNFRFKGFRAVDMKEPWES